MTNQLEVKLFGGVTFLLDGRPLNSTPTRAAQALLVYLLHQSRPVERERLIDMFYQASTPRQAAANLRSTLSRLRKELAPFLDITNRTVAIAADADIRIDAADFERLMAEGEEARALALYEGDFLAGFFLRDAPEFETWALVERERLHLLAVRGLRSLIGEAQQTGDYWAALEMVNRLLAIEPLLEEMHRLKMELLARTGQAPLALQQYETAVSLFADELGLSLAPETTALCERLMSRTMPPPVRLPAASDDFMAAAEKLRL